MTVTGMQERSFTADVMAETLRRSSLGVLGKGAAVNLERAMAADGRFGGHIVSVILMGRRDCINATRRQCCVGRSGNTATAVALYCREGVYCY